MGRIWRRPWNRRSSRTSAKFESNFPWIVWSVSSGWYRLFWRIWKRRNRSSLVFGVKRDRIANPNLQSCRPYLWGPMDSGATWSRSTCSGRFAWPCRQGLALRDPPLLETLPRSSRLWRNIASCTRRASQRWFGRHHRAECKSLEWRRIWRSCFSLPAAIREHRRW